MVDIWNGSGKTGGSATTSASSGAVLPLDTSSADATANNRRYLRLSVSSYPVRIAFGTSSSVSVADTDEMFQPGAVEYIARNGATYFSIKGVGGTATYSIGAGEIV